MIRKALNKYLRDNVAELTTVLDSHYDLNLSSITKPFATISYLNGRQDLWVIGDSARVDIVRMQLSIFSDSLDTQTKLRNKITRVIETAFTDGEPGIPLIAYNADFTTTDYKTYTSGQTDWYTGSSPVVYKNGNVVSPTLYSVNTSGGIVTFGSANQPSDIIRADYGVQYLDNSGNAKEMYLDFLITGISDVPITDIANVTHKFNTFFTLDTYMYVRRIGQKLF